MAFSFFLLGLGLSCNAQFKEEAFTQSYNDKSDSLSRADTTDKLVTFDEIFGGLSHKRPMRIGTMFGTSMVIPGAAQIYNRQYWKLPLVYGGIGAGVACGIVYGNKFKSTSEQKYKNISTWSYIGAGVMYYASLMDGVISYKSDRKPHPGRATVFSILCPGLGQAYNGEYWKIPIYVGGLVASAYFFDFNRTNYIRFRDIYREASESGYTGPITAEQAKYYRDEYRRYRDYSVIAFALVYLLQVIDANVFAYMNDFDVSENVAMSISPSVTMPEYYAMNQPCVMPAAGLRFGLRF